MRLAGEEASRLLLRRHYGNQGCFYCKNESHIYQNCPERPCYLCKGHGHIASRCPYGQQASTNNTGGITNAISNGNLRTHQFTRVRELNNLSCLSMPHIPIHLRALTNANVALMSPNHHATRICAAEWCPDGSMVVSGDKRGMVRIWPFNESFNKPGVLSSSESSIICPHRCNINSFSFNPTNPSTLYSCSADGTVCASDIEVGACGGLGQGERQIGEILLDINPDGWVSASKWNTFHALCFDSSHGALYCGASDGSIVVKDVRDRNDESSISSRAKFHAKKITHLSQNPVQPNLLVTSSNDANVCLWDVRKFIPRHHLGVFTHDAVVSSAVFSPNSGAKLLTTSFDNRLRVWTDVHAFQGNCNNFVDSQPSATFVHSHDSHRYLTPFKACWDPKDWTDDTFVCGRFLPQAFTLTEEDDGDNIGHQDNAVLLRPVDIFSLRRSCPENANAPTSNSEPVISLVDESVPLILTINRFSPTADVLLSAASTNIYIWVSPEQDQRGRKDSKRGTLVPRNEKNNGGEDDENDEDDGGDDGGSGSNKRKKRLSLSMLRCKRTCSTNTKSADPSKD